MRNTDPYILAFDVEERASELMPLPEEAQKVGIDNYRIQVAPWTKISLPNSVYNIESGGNMGDGVSYFTRFMD